MATTLPQQKAAVDPLTAATVTTAWVIFLNKPFYPLYVWWLVGSGVQASLATMLAAPFFGAVIVLARYRPLWARAALPLVGLVDTIFETKLFGAASGTELFLAPCVMLAAVSFRAGEEWWSRAVTAIIFVGFFATHDRLGEAWHLWTNGELSILLNLNAFAVASLMAFIALKFVGKSA